MSDNEKSRKYQLTINNPLEKGCNHAEINKRMEDIKFFTIAYVMKLANRARHTRTFILYVKTQCFSVELKSFFLKHILSQQEA